VDRYDLIHHPKEKRLANLVAKDIASVSPETRLTLHELALSDPWDFEEVYSKLHEFSGQLDFVTAPSRPLASVITGSQATTLGPRSGQVQGDRPGPQSL